MPDVLLGFKEKQKLINSIYFEVKKPTASSKYQEEIDWVKLLKSNALVSDSKAVTYHREQRELMTFGTLMLLCSQFNTYKKSTAHISSFSGVHMVLCADFHR